MGIGAGLTAFNYLFGQSLDASKYVTSTMLFVYIVIIIGMVWSIRFKTISPHNHRKILRFFYLVVGLVVALAAVGDGANYPHRRQQYYGVDFEISDLQQQLCTEFHQIRRQAHDSTLFRTGIFRSGINLNFAQHQTVWYKTPKTDAMILAGIILSGSFSGVMTFILFYLLEWAFQYQ